MPSHDSMTREQVRSIDRRAIGEFGLCGLVLMENAGRGATDLLRSRGVSGPVVLCCGKGNNGGDGFVIARHLEAAGVEIEVLLLTDPAELSGEAAVNFEILRHAQTPITEARLLSPVEWSAKLRSADWIVDALLGTGARGSLRDPFGAIIECINTAGRPVLAVDLPSGMDCDTGQPLGACVQAQITATFVARKVGFDAPDATALTGEVIVLPIGVPRRLLGD